MRILLLTLFIGCIGCGSSATAPTTPTPSATTPVKSLALPGPTIFAIDGGQTKVEPPEPKVQGDAPLEPKEVQPEKAPPIGKGWKPLTKTDDFYIEAIGEQRRLHLVGEVCLREGPLEVLLCRAGTKEHEAIVAVDLDARLIHTALVAIGLKPGATVKYQPRYIPVSGDAVKITLTYYLDGKLRENVPAQEWVREIRTKKQLAYGWVFGGSRLVQDPEDKTKPPFYCANNGEVISVANFPDSMLDLPVQSSKETNDLAFEAFTDRIPGKKTKVIITLEASPKEKP